MTLLQKVNDLKASDDAWVCYSDFKPVSISTDDDSIHELTNFFWMSPYQVKLAERFGGVVQVDVSEGRNVYNFYLTTFVIVDGENKSRNLAYSLHNRQDALTFEWMFRRLDMYLNKGYPFTAIFSDRDPAIISAVEKVWPGIFHGHCLWHLLKNIKKRVGRLLLGEFNRFMSDFWKVYSMGSPPMFVEQWANLLRTWPIAAPYLSSSIFPDRDTFAWAWVGTRFLAGMRTTGRVETEHKNYKLHGLSASSTFNEVFDLLNDRTVLQKELAIWQRYKVRTIMRTSKNVGISSSASNFYGIEWFLWTNPSRMSTIVNLLFIRPYT